MLNFRYRHQQFLILLLHLADVAPWWILLILLTALTHPTHPTHDGYIALGIDPSKLPPGVDPSYLAAIPVQMRQEVKEEQRSKVQGECTSLASASPPLPVLPSGSTQRTSDDEKLNSLRLEMKRITRQAAMPGVSDEDRRSLYTRRADVTTEMAAIYAAAAGKPFKFRLLRISPCQSTWRSTQRRHSKQIYVV